MVISEARVTRIELNDRGDPAGFDVIQATMTMDNAWHNLDLSAIVPADAGWILLRVNIVHGDALARNLYFRKEGNVNAIATPGIVKQERFVFNEAEILVPCSAARIIEYKANGPITVISIVILGWINGA